MRASDFDILIVPNLGGAAEGDWPSRWRAKLSTARFVHPPDPADRRREAWTEAVARAALEAQRPALFIGHGLGAVAIADASAALDGADVRGAFLAAPPDAQGLERLTSSDWTPARAPLPWPSVVVTSRNDPQGVYDAVAALATDWGAESHRRRRSRRPRRRERPWAVAGGADPACGVHQGDRRGPTVN